VIVSGSVTGPSSLYRLRTDGTGTAQRLTTGKLGQTPTGWTPDGSELIFLEGGDIYALSMSALTVRPIVVSPQAETHATISPDGKWIAYGLNLSGRSEVFVQPYPGLNGRIQVSTQGGHSPRWTKGGRELLYYQANGISEASIMVVDVTASANFQRPAPRTLFTAPAADLVPTTPSTLYDVTPNGDRIFTSTLTNRTPPAPTKINLILNWFDELRAKVSGGGNPQ
jgi:Tol biopolymer transport system component